MWLNKYCYCFTYFVHEWMYYSDGTTKKIARSLLLKVFDRKVLKLKVNSFWSHTTQPKVGWFLAVFSVSLLIQQRCCNTSAKELKDFCNQSVDSSIIFFHFQMWFHKHEKSIMGLLLKAIPKWRSTIFYFLQTLIDLVWTSFV